MSQERSYTTYKFDELPAYVQGTAVEKLYDLNVDHDWWEFLYDDWKERLEKLGYENVDIMFSGFGSQGDGASFTANINVDQYLKKKKLKAKYKRLGIDDIHALVYRESSSYVHENTIDAEVIYDGDYRDDPKADKLIEDLEEQIRYEARKLSKDIYKSLGDEHDYLTSPEVVAESIRTNDYDFDADGNLV